MIPAFDPVKKADLIQKILATLDAELENYARSARAAHEEATHEQSKAENKYDTRGLEASYLARGQSRQAAETLQAREEYAQLAARDFAPGEAVDVGALVELESTEDGPALYFIGPRAGGREVVCGKKTVLVITPQSPLGSQLMGRKAGDRLNLKLGGAQRGFRILSVG